MFEFITETIGVAGKVLVAYTAIRVHHRVWKEHRIDERVFTAMRKEQVLGILGVTLIIAAYVAQDIVYPLLIK